MAASVKFLAMLLVVSLFCVIRFTNAQDEGEAGGEDGGEDKVGSTTILQFWLSNLIYASDAQIVL